MGTAPMMRDIHKFQLVLMNSFFLVPVLLASVHSQLFFLSLSLVNS